MDDQQPTFNQQFPNPYPFDTDMMKRSMESVAGPDSNKKARWSPTSSFPASTGTQTSAAPPPSARQPSFENYGYGGFPANGQGQQQSQQQQQQSQGQQQQQLYSTPAPLTLNASNLAPNTNSASGGGVSPNTLFAPGQNGGLNTPFAAQTPYSAMFPGYGMNMMGMMGGYGFSPQTGTFPQQSFQPQNAQSLASLNIPAAQGYSPAVAAAAAAAAGNQTGRTVYVGNLPSDASVDELLNLVHFGPLESVRVLPEKSCVFISFLDGATAAAFHADATVKKLALHGQELKIGWGKASPVPSQVMLSITQSNASRNVYLGGLDENMTEEQLRDDLSRFGLIDQVKIVRDKNIGFVHFLSISVATKVVATLPTEPAWAGKRVNYGKDRCAYVPKSQQAAQQAAQVAAAQSLVAQAQAQSAAQGLFPPFTPYDQTTMPTTPASTAMAMMAAAAAGAGSPGGVASAMNRTVYLGNIHPETTAEDLCNAIRGGVLQSIRYMQDKHIAFVTFIDPTAAFTFFQVASFQGLTLNNRRLKIGWGKNSGPLPPALALAVHSGATRNVYVGNIEDFELFSEDRLKKDFGEFGDIELVNFLKEKNCAFVNFTNISNAIKAIDSIKNKPEYANLRIAHGKDRCANPPRSGPQGGGGGRRGGGAGVSPGAGEGLEGEIYAEPTDAVVLGEDDHMQDHESPNGNGHVKVDPVGDEVPHPE